jgi:hypothetical protein
VFWLSARAMSEAGGVHSAGEQRMEGAVAAERGAAADELAGGGAFFSLRFGAEHGVVPMAEQLQAALEQRGASGKIVNMTAGGDIDTEVFQSIERCSTFLVFGSAKYGEDTGNQACTYYEYKHAFAKKKKIVLIRMIPFDQEFDNLQARVIFNANRLVLPWMLGAPMPADLPDRILQVMGRRAAPDTAPEPQPAPRSAQPAAAWPEELLGLVSVPPFVACLADLGVHSLADFGENVDLEEVSYAERAPHSHTGTVGSHSVRALGPRPDHASGA